MQSVQLPISKSIANRLLILQALHGEPLLDVSGKDIPDDVWLMYEALRRISRGETVVDLQNCGTAMRFLTAYCAQLEGVKVILDGCTRMRQRPIRPLVDALNSFGADIRYEGEFGYPPLCIHGRKLSHSKVDNILQQAVTVPSSISSQFVSAMLLIGMQVDTNDVSPYINMTRQVLNRWGNGERELEERDWSAAAFWYEYIALHGGALLLKGLKPSSLQGDQAVASIYRRFGVETDYTPQGVVIEKKRHLTRFPLIMRFNTCPDLYPAVAITCHQLHIPLLAFGIQSLHFKESDRIVSVKERKTFGDHRIAMALLAADLPCDDTECVSKSYPSFNEQLCQLHG